MKSTPLFDKIKASCKEGQKQFAVLVDPDDLDLEHLQAVIDLSVQAAVDYFFVGGSLMINDQTAFCINELKSRTGIPVILFPGNAMHVHHQADALLFLSLISGRNPEFLIGQHVVAAPVIQKANLEVIPVGYMLIDGGRTTSVSYMSNTVPIPRGKKDIAVSTALAGRYLGLGAIYMDAGSGAHQEVPSAMIRAIRDAVDLPLIVGGGIKDAETIYRQAKAGADILVVGNAIEKDPALIMQMRKAINAVGNHEKTKL